jgi:hypothetical protein
MEEIVVGLRHQIFCKTSKWYLPQNLNQIEMKSSYLIKIKRKKNKKKHNKWVLQKHFLKKWTNLNKNLRRRLMIEKKDLLGISSCLRQEVSRPQLKKKFSKGGKKWWKEKVRNKNKNKLNELLNLHIKSRIMILVYSPIKI